MVEHRGGRPEHCAQGCHRRQGDWRKLPGSYASGLPSFGLGRDVSAGPGTAGPRCAAQLRPRLRRSRACAGLPRRIGSVASDAAGAPDEAAQARGSRLMRIDAGRSFCLALMLAVMHAGVAAAEPQIVWQVENPFRFFLDPADTQVHRATWLSLSESRAQPSRAVGGAGAERAPSRRLERLHVHQDLLGRDTQPLRLPRACRLSQSQEPYGPGAAGGPRRRANRRLQLADLAARAGRGPRNKAVTLPCDTPVQLDVPYPSGAWISVEIGGSQVAETAARVTDLFIVGMGDSFASGEGNPDVPVRFSPERTTDYGFGAPTMRRSPAIRPASATGRRSATRTSSRRTRAGRTRPATARSTRTSCGPRCSSPSRTRIAP